MTDTPLRPARAQLSRGEFIALMAMTAATVAFSIDAMLPALPEIGAALSPDALNRAQLIIMSFVLGMGLGTFVAGPLSDRFGRKPVMIGGGIIYTGAALAAWVAPTLELMLAARMVQGLGASGPRVVAMAMIRDRYAGRDMAQILSFVMLIFALVPAIAPTMGWAIIEVFGWRGIFLAFVVFSLVTMLWLGLRQPETLARENRRPLKWALLLSATREMFAHPTSRLSIFVQTLSFGMLFSVLSSTQQVFDLTYGQGHVFHLWFGGIAIVSASSGVLNARLVVRLGMRPIIKGMFTVQIGLSALMVLAVLLPLPDRVEFACYVIWVASVFFQAGMTIGNLNALAMEPMGHIAGLAASIIASVATVGAVIIAIPIGLSFDGTPLPMAIGALVCAVLALWLTSMIRRESD